MATKPVTKKSAKPVSTTASAKTAASSSAVKINASAQAEVGKLDQEIIKLLNRRAAATFKKLQTTPTVIPTQYCSTVAIVVIHSFIMFVYLV